MVSSLISSVRGSLEGIGPDWVDVQVGGVSFRVNVPASSIDHLGQIGEPVRLYTSLQVREDSLTLYGFLTSDMRRAFVTLLGISGVGPRLALAIMSRFTPDSLALAVSTADTDAFSTVSGVGKKTASRIVLELKGKLDGDWAIAPDSSTSSDLIDALTALGYTANEAREAAMSLPRGSNEPLEEQVRLALQKFSGG